MDVVTTRLVNPELRARLDGGARPPSRIRRPGHLALEVADLGRAVDFYTRILRLVRVQEVEGVVYLRSQFGHHCLELHGTGRSGLHHTGWETDSDQETDALRDALVRRGIPVRDAPPEPGRRGLAFQFQDPMGFWHEVYRAMDRLPVLVSNGPFPVLRQAHFAFNSPDVDRDLEFFRAVGFRVSDWSPGRQASLRCLPEHHNISLFAHGRARFHHQGFDIGSWEHLKEILDWIAHQEYPVEVGPVRHALGNNISVYLLDPDRFRIELFCEMEQILDDEDHENRRQPPLFDLWRRQPVPADFRE
jgi:catechol 2,3-dioxygenase-like lactoylglutathione lyase family enzyme